MAPGPKGEISWPVRTGPRPMVASSSLLVVKNDVGDLQLPAPVYLPQARRHGDRGLPLPGACVLVEGAHERLQVLGQIPGVPAVMRCRLPDTLEFAADALDGQPRVLPVVFLHALAPLKKELCSALQGFGVTVRKGGRGVWC